MYNKKLSLILIIGAVLAGLVCYPFLPDRLVIQLGNTGLPSNDAPKWLGIFLVPLAMLVLHTTRNNAARFVHEANRGDARLIFSAVQCIAFAVQLLILLYGLEPERFNFQAVTMVLTGGLFIIAGNVLYRARRSYGHGIKNRWTLSSEKVWVQCHRAGSLLFMAAGLLVVIFNGISLTGTTLFAGTLRWSVMVLAGCVVLCYLLSFVFYQHYNGDRKVS